MKTLQDHIDDLDRMVDSGSAPKHEIRSQIAFVGREVAALQAGYSALAAAHTALQQSKLESDTKADALLRQNEKLSAETWRQRANAAHIPSTFEPQ